ncbi:hypothetical protein ASPVEDRAFT_75826 [Aspergillus versicolor CBS 583.65]|uniref:Uncharacterized protein n=1 Tax=Aspergillus versicolor CBS 583.65 TaxID=1036611 RepID=A0A1L9PZ42_ASPVE|nr:uncharacterized protein ASPVEDRAFT_75826 [Aspergillus versicolor CBS 583.65]OJJ06797.1 hypothetical protein ASPVEDRAFT_75826 [Aspergillus versicolor CBS 583.65]
MMYGKRNRYNKVPAKSNLPTRPLKKSVLLSYPTCIQLTAVVRHLPPSIVTSPFFPNIFAPLLELDPHPVRFPNGPDQLWARMSKLTKTHYPEPDDAVLAARESQNIRSTTLEVLNAGISRCFEKGPNQVFLVFNALFDAAVKGETDINGDPWVPPDEVKIDLSRWLNTFSPTHVLDAARVYTDLIILIACKGNSQSLIDATRFLAPTPGIFLTMNDIKHQPSANLSALFNQAKKAAIDGKIGKTTILPVHLVDVELVQIAKMRLRTEDYPTFEHCFVIGVAREGWRLYQAWGNPYKRRGFRLDEWIMADGNRVRSWEEGKKWMRLFDRFVSKKGLWTEELNEIYRDLFIPSMKNVEKRRELSGLEILRFWPHVRVLGPMDVAIEDIQKFNIVDQADAQPSSTSKTPIPTEMTETKTAGSLSMTGEQAEEWYKSTCGPVETTASGPMVSQDPSIYASLTTASTTESARSTNPSAEKAKDKPTRGFFGPTGLPVCPCCVKPMKGPSTRPATQPSAKTVAKASAKAAGKSTVNDISSVEAEPVYDDADGDADADADTDSETTIVIDHEFYIKTRIPVEAEALDNGEGPCLVETAHESLSTALENVDAEIDSALRVAKAKLNSIPDYGFCVDSGTAERDVKALNEETSGLDVKPEAVGNAKASSKPELDSPGNASPIFNAEVEPVLNLARTKLDGLRDHGSRFGFRGLPRFRVTDCPKSSQPDAGVDLQVGVESKDEVTTDTPASDEALGRAEVEPSTTATSNAEIRVEAEANSDIDIGVSIEGAGVDKETTVNPTPGPGLYTETETRVLAKAEHPVKSTPKVYSDVEVDTAGDAEASTNKTPAQIGTEPPTTVSSGFTAEEAGVTVNAQPELPIAENSSELKLGVADGADEVKPHASVKTPAHPTAKPPIPASSKAKFRGGSRGKSAVKTPNRVIPKNKNAVKPPPKVNIPRKLTPIPEQDENHESTSEDESDGGVSLNVHDGSESRFQELNLGVARWETTSTSQAGGARVNQGRDYLQAFNLAGPGWNAELDRFRMGLKTCNW